MLYLTSNLLNCLVANSLANPFMFNLFQISNIADKGTNFAYVTSFCEDQCPENCDNEWTFLNRASTIWEVDLSFDIKCGGIVSIIFYQLLQTVLAKDIFMIQLMNFYDKSICQSYRWFRGNFEIYI